MSSARSLSSRSRSRLFEKSDHTIKPNNKVSSRDSLPIVAYYINQDDLVEISIIKPPYKIDSKMINAFFAISPFHPYLTKLTIKYNGLTSTVFHLIAKLQPNSNITEICLDDTYLAEGSYFELLDRTSKLRVLSLNRCKINDLICKEIAIRIDFGSPGEKLAALSLASNMITDDGVWYLGDILRRNRHLRHLNLAGNKITDNGLKYLMAPLAEFPLTCEEIIEKKQRKLKFIRNRIELCNRYSEEGIDKKGYSVLFSDNLKTSKRGKSSSPRPSPRYVKRRSQKQSMRRNTIDTRSNYEKNAEQKIKLIPKDPYDDDNTLINNGFMYCIGNFTLCYLNLAYNNLQFCSVKTIQRVLRYQNKMTEQVPKTKLMRLVLDGNNIPIVCPELKEIERLLKEPAVVVSSRPLISPRKKSCIGVKYQ